MTTPRRSGSTPMNRWRITQFSWTSWKAIKYETYLFILVCLLLFCALSFVYFYVPSPLQQTAPQFVSTPTVTATAVTCGFPLSGQYGIVPASLYFVLVPLTILLRSYTWLSAGTAAWVMTYAAVSVLHLIVLFVYNDRWAEDQQRNHCDMVPLENGTMLPICRGVQDPDYILAGGLIASGLLAVLPLGKWSYTFRRAEARPILVLWTLMLAVGHIFFMLAMPNPNLNYQICTAGYTEPLPGFGFSAGNYDDTFRGVLHSILRNDSAAGERADPSCIYSCFGVDGYLGRQRGEIGIFKASISNRYISKPLRMLGTAFWLIYALLSVTALLTSKPHARHSLRYQLRPQNVAILRHYMAGVTLPKHRFANLGENAHWRSFLDVITLSRCRDRISTSRIWLRSRDKMQPDLKSNKGFSWACGICLLRRAVQILSACSYVGFVAYGYVEVVQIPNSEPSSAVGQWGSVAAVGLALLAAAVSWITTHMPTNENLESQELQSEEMLNIKPVPAGLVWEADGGLCGDVEHMA